VGDVVAKHAIAVREDRRTAHALRHTFCTMLAKRGVAMEVIRALAGHVDIRTTQIYVDVTDQRKADGILRSNGAGIRWRRSGYLYVVPELTRRPRPAGGAKTVNRTGSGLSA
jgi:hypothetical protein